MTVKRAVSDANKRLVKRYYGWLPDLPDQRDYLLSTVMRVPALLPASMDLRPLCSAVEDQGQLGSCTANALAGALEYLERRDRVAFEDFSRLFIYYNERAIEHTIKVDSGAMIRDGIKSLAGKGVCSEKLWPYKVSMFAKKPTPACYRQALKHRITSYHRILTLDEMRSCLASGFPFVFGFTVYESFESRQVAETGIVRLPSADEKALGGHAVLAVGYDDKTGRFIVRNSWGEGWGIKGYFTMPYAYLTDRNLSDDLWTVRRG
jgi:C1A family cysteine protease